MFAANPFLTPHGLKLNVGQSPPAGPPLVLMHGVLRAWRDFVPLLPAFTTRWQVHGVDLRGHGLSDRSLEPYLVVNYVRDVVALLRHGLAEPAVLYGHSLGAMVAAAAAAEAPERVRGLVLEDPPFHTMGSRIRQTVFHSQFVGLQKLVGWTGGTSELARQLAELRLLKPETGETFRLGDVRDGTALRFSARCLQRVDPHVLAPIVAGQWLDGYDLETICPRIPCPTLLLQADLAAGGMLTDDDAKRVERLIPDCIRMRLPSVGHLIHWSHTETTLRLVLGFLESLDHLA